MLCRNEIGIGVVVVTAAGMQMGVGNIDEDAALGRELKIHRGRYTPRSKKVVTTVRRILSLKSQSCQSSTLSEKFDMGCRDSVRVHTRVRNSLAHKMDVDSSASAAARSRISPSNRRMNW